MGCENRALDSLYVDGEAEDFVVGISVPVISLLHLLTHRNLDIMELKDFSQFQRL